VNHTAKDFRQIMKMTAPILILLALLVIVPDERFADIVRMSGNAISRLLIACGHILGCVGSGFVLSLLPVSSGYHSSLSRLSPFSLEISVFPPDMRFEIGSKNLSLCLLLRLRHFGYEIRIFGTICRIFSRDITR